MLGALKPDNEKTHNKGASFNLTWGYLEGDKRDNNATPPHLETISRP